MGTPVPVPNGRWGAGGEDVAVGAAASLMVPENMERRALIVQNTGAEYIKIGNSINQFIQLGPEDIIVFAEPFVVLREVWAKRRDAADSTIAWQEIL